MVIIGMILFMIGWVIICIGSCICGIYRAVTNKKPINTTRKQNPIDKHGDYYYGTINWLKDGKL